MRNKHHIGTSQPDRGAKPYGFCCDIKDYDPRLDTKPQLGSVFSRNNVTGEGPDIKIRLQEINSNVLPSSQRGNQKSSYRIEDHLGKPMICRRCRGPLKWYLEDEVAVARNTMMTQRQQQYNEKMEQNIKTAKKKGT
ncbi:hypothetical protein WN55_10809 [Dufourea novaeangliae]|uniref:Uncharacterized protein n=1 Tax=Dufourea novaeangliae TaxID=178035 RepID=A0A154P9H7_DUFNO|nr:hypothetical protein WN55_10809 [Dufourea novaeangliae]